MASTGVNRETLYLRVRSLQPIGLIPPVTLLCVGPKLFRGSAIGSTPAFGAGYPGSSPGPGANLLFYMWDCTLRCEPFT
jgi:hypothetical protein